MLRALAVVKSTDETKRNKPNQTKANRHVHLHSATAPGGSHQEQRSPSPLPHWPFFAEDLLSARFPTAHKTDVTTLSGFERERPERTMMALPSSRWASCRHLDLVLEGKQENRDRDVTERVGDAGGVAEVEWQRWRWTTGRDCQCRSRPRYPPRPSHLLLVGQQLTTHTHISQ